MMGIVALHRKQCCNGMAPLYSQDYQVSIRFPIIPFIVYIPYYITEKLAHMRQQLIHATKHELDGYVENLSVRIYRQAETKRTMAVYIKLSHLALGIYPMPQFLGPQLTASCMNYSCMLTETTFTLICYFSYTYAWCDVIIGPKMN